MEGKELSLPNNNTIGKPSVIAAVIGPIVQSKILSLVINGYNILVKSQQVQADWDEDRITSAMGIEITNVWRSLEFNSPVYSYTPQTQYPLFPKVSKQGKAKSIDFVFLKGFTQQIYFAFECKIVDNSKPRLVSEYVENGMKRFITGYYSANLFVAGMIGYLFNNQVVGTVDKINVKIKGCANLSVGDCLDPDLSDVTVRGYLYKSKHLRTTDNNEFTIRHLFFTF